MVAIQQDKKKEVTRGFMNLEEALKWIADLFEESVENIQPETSKEDILAWDSLGILTLMASLDEDFDIILTEEEIQQLRNVNSIFEILRKNGQLS